MSELDQLRQEAEQLKNQIRVRSSWVHLTTHVGVRSHGARFREEGLKNDGVMFCTEIESQLAQDVLIPEPELWSSTGFAGFCFLGYRCLNTLNVFP